MVAVEERELFLEWVRNLERVSPKPEPELAPVRKALRRKKPLPYEARIDLHGMTVEQASYRIRAFIGACQAKKLRRILVIHGKGSGILRDEIRMLLGGLSSVKEVQEAPPRLGGEGAVLIAVE
ncbi:MAG: Smr/MutS family protein [Myxococcaceae bacterium]|nr:Smr/MutS family protein [Myxococcaceae bacterium]MBH2005920.1 Smr/MutS family protein [Myxococcaceae bacterium]